MKRGIAILGLGIFGSKLALEIERSGKASVLALDISSKAIDRIKEHVSQAFVGDATDPDVIQELEAGSFECVVVGMGSHLESQILAITFLKNQGARRILAKANSSVQKDILLKVGADQVVLPEEESAMIIAKKLSNPNINDVTPFADGFMGNVKVPKRLVGFTLKEMDLRERYKMSVILYRKGVEEPKILWNPNTVLNEGDELTVISEGDNIAEVFGE